MLIDQANLGPGPAHQHLAAVLRAEINAGRLRPGEQLPPSRTLAEELGVSRWVVTEAYDQLKAEGYLSGRVGSGTRVAGPGGTTDERGDDAGDRAAVPASASLGSTAVDLSPALPDLASFPRTVWRAAMARALDGVTDHQLGHPDPAGTPQLRQTLAGYLRRVRAIEASASGPVTSVLVTQGVGNAVDLICRHLVADGARRVAVEDPSWPRLRQIVIGNGLEVIGVPVDADGLSVDHLVDADRQGRIDAVVTMPTHQFPTGVPLSAPRRRALIEWAREGVCWIVEDDYDAEFRYDRRPVGALATLAPDRVIYLGSVSKTLSPSLHLGWMVAPTRLLESITTSRAGLGALAPTLEQLTLVDLIASGAYDRHLRRMRRHYQARRRAMLDALVGSVPGGPAPSMDAGLHVLWRLPVGTAETAVVARCRERGLLVLGESACHLRASTAPGLVLGYGNVPGHRAAEVARTLAEAVVTTA